MKLLVTASVSLLLSAGTTAIAQTAHPPVNVVLDASDFVTVLTWAFGFLGLFLVIIAFLGVAFFGFDVRNARAAIDREMGELRKAIAEAKTLKEELEKTSKLQRKTQNDLEEIGAKVEEQETVQSASVSTTEPETRNLPDLIRAALRLSRFKWTTIGTVTKRTGLSHDQILLTVPSMNDVVSGIGKRSQELILRFKNDQEL